MKVRDMPGLVIFLAVLIGAAVYVFLWLFVGNRIADRFEEQGEEWFGESGR